MSECVSECWMFYAVLTSKLIFTSKTGLDFSRALVSIYHMR